MSTLMSDRTDIKKDEAISFASKLEAFGFSPTDTRIYLHLIRKDPQTIHQIAQDMHMPRTTIYDSAMRLIEKGLLERIVIYKSQRLKAYPLEILQTIIDKKKATIDELSKNLLYLKRALKSSPRQNTATQVRYYHGVQGMMQMLWNTLEAQDGTIGYSESGRITVVGKKFKLDWNKRMIDKGITDRVIINPAKETIIHHFHSVESLSRDKFQTTRVLGEEQLYITGDTTIYNNVFAVCYWKQGEVVGVEIENPEFVKNQKSIFEKLWKIAKPAHEYANFSQAEGVFS